MAAGPRNVIFPSTPPSGRYIVRVDTFSLCAETTAAGVFARLLTTKCLRLADSRPTSIHVFPTARERDYRPSFLITKKER